MCYNYVFFRRRWQGLRNGEVRAFLWSFSSFSFHYVGNYIVLIQCISYFFRFSKISLGFLVLPWERGLSFRNWLKALKHFTTNQKWRFHEIPALAVPNTNLVPRVNWFFEIYARIVIGQTTTCHLVLVLQHKNLSQNKKPRSVIWVFVLSICAHNP